MIDLHTHVLPAVDDGARTLGEARALALHLASQGVTVIAATPHVRDDYPTTPDVMEEAVAEVRADFEAHRVPIEVVHGAEIDLGLLWAIPQEDLPRLTIAQTGRYLLLEFPYRGWPFALDSAVKRLVELGVTPLLAHPERNPEVQDRPDRVRGLVESGALVQVTAASLEGSRDRAAQAARCGGDHDHAFAPRPYFLSRYPVERIHHVVARQAKAKAAVMPMLMPTRTSAIS